MNYLQTPTSQPLVSVVITTRNEEKNIRNCLHSIRAQTWSAIEAIVVDNYSTDATLEISAQLADKFTTKGPERSAQRNHGMINLARGEYVMYIDADMILSPQLVECCVEHIQRTGAAAKKTVRRKNHDSATKLINASVEKRVAGAAALAGAAVAWMNFLLDLGTQL
mgnify:CR=1 FL=1